jgi:predicted permease
MAGFSEYISKSDKTPGSQPILFVFIHFTGHFHVRYIVNKKVFIMSDALQKTLTLLLLIALGLLLRGKFKSKDQTNGIKEIILSVALPSTIFISLMKIDVDSSMIIIPVVTLVFNFLMFFSAPLAFALFGIEKNSPTGRTLMMLIPSLAPGLSCFPFIAEFLGEKSLAIAALADVGNKFFVLISLYILAMNMFLKNSHDTETKMGGKLKSLFGNMLQEPINVLIILALVLLGFGINYSTLPFVITEIFDKTSAMMTPLVLLFIGLAVQLKEGKKRIVASILLFRAGSTMLISAGMIYVLNITDQSMILLAIVIPLSAASFWPLAHISAFNLREDALGLAKEKRTFDMELAVLLLAFSLPFSTILILGILSTGALFTHMTTLVISGAVLITLGGLPNLFSKMFVRVSKA